MISGSKRVGTPALKKNNPESLLSNQSTYVQAHPILNPWAVSA